MLEHLEQSEHAIFKTNRSLFDGLVIVPQPGEVSPLEPDPEMIRAERYRRFIGARPPTDPNLHRLLGKTTHMVNVNPMEN